MIDINTLTVGEIREINALFNSTASSVSIPAHPYKIGAKYFIRTVTHHYSGQLKAVYAGELVLTQCAWIADDGRFADMLVSGKPNEVEPYPEGSEVIINRGSVEDIVEVTWKQLPLSQK